MRVESEWGFKEWAVVCEAVARGIQSILLRKGGIHEHGGTFTPEHDRFWLFPTGFHQSANELAPEFAPLTEALASRTPPAGTIPLREFVRVEAVAWLDREAQLDRLAGKQILSRETLAKRFHYRSPGLYVLLVRAFVADVPATIESRPEFDGCKSWVPFGRLVAADARPVLDDARFESIRDDWTANLDGLKARTR